MHTIYIVPGNDLENGAAAKASFDMIVMVQKWTITGKNFWIKEDPGKMHYKEYVYMS
jgi:hypothetical protein